MIRSMTGYGRGERQIGGTYVAVDARSVNHRYLDVKLKLPPEVLPLESRLKKIVSRRVGRGRLDLTVNVRRDNGSPDVRVNRALLRSYVKAARTVQKETGVPGEMSLTALLQLPGAVRLESRSTSLSRAETTGVLRAAEDAVAALCGMRAKEGNALADDLEARLRAVRKRVRVIRSRARGLGARMTRRLRERVRKLTDGVGADPDRLAQEVAFLADRCDVSEEIVRLEAHLGAMEALLRKKDPAGKRLDFLTQELHREINTIHSKAGDLSISRVAIEIKSEVEKIREQVQNIE